ncbi:MAG TPA: hypothetical protein VJ372_24570 [Pyrinomonadaceae bacterium]|jgi:hypothetical protein|nr:hypothetical protein [Pyrinomonadaceae bacterium]
MLVPLPFGLLAMAADLRGRSFAGLQLPELPVGSVAKLVLLGLMREHMLMLRVHYSDMLQIDHHIKRTFLEYA